MTLMHRARQGEIPPAIALAAQSEHVAPESFRDLVAAGRVVIPATGNAARSAPSPSAKASPSR